MEGDGAMMGVGDDEYPYADDPDDPAPNTDTNCGDGGYEDWPADTDHEREDWDRFDMNAPYYGI